MEKIYNTGESQTELCKKYCPEGSIMRMAQKRMTKMLSYLDAICKENGIQYCIICGTLLGAYRHGGFIPWDNDVDIIISDKDLKKLTQIINSSSSDYIVQNHKTDPGFVRYYSVLRDLHSEYVKEEFVHNARKYRGVQIDLFPYGRNVISGLRSVLTKTVSLNERFFLKKYRLLSESTFFFSRYCLLPIFKCISGLSHGHMIGFGYESIFKYFWKEEDIFPLSTIEFDGILVCCPNNIESVLVKTYGPKYMDLPDIKNRNPHFVETIHFD